MTAINIYFIIGFTIHENADLRSRLSQMLESELPAKRINESSYSISQYFPVPRIKERLNEICRKCRKEGFVFQECDFIKLYYSALLADSNCDIQERSMLCEYSVDLKCYR